MAGVPFVTIILSGAGKAFPTEVVDAPPDADPNVSSLCRRFLTHQRSGTQLGSGTPWRHWIKK